MHCRALNIKDLTIGFSTGCFYKAGFDNPNHFIERILKAGGKAIELQYFTVGSDRTGYLERIDLDLLSELKHVTLHLTSKREYRNDKDTRYIMARQTEAYERFGCTEAIIHPDRIFEKSIIDDYRNQMNILIENMDAYKDSHRTPKDLKPYDDYQRILDIQHVYSADPEINNITSYIPPAGLGEIHISGLNNYPELHYPLFKQKQDRIIEVLRGLLKIEEYKNIPIIIESCFDKPGDEAIELQYILDRLN